MSLPPTVYMTPRQLDEAHFFPSLIPVQAVEPASSAQFWVDTSTAPPTLKGWDGAAWVAVGGGGGGADPTKVPLAGGTMTGDLVVNNAKVSAGTTTDVLGTALEVKRNSVAVGRIDNNANGLRVQAQAGTLQLRGTGNTGIAIDSAGVADFASVPTTAGAKLGIAPVTTPRVGDWFTAPDIKTYAVNSNQTRSSGTGPWLTVPVYDPITVDALACYVDTLEAASTIRLGLLAVDGNGFATTLLGSVSVSGAATGQQSQTFGAPIVLTPGRYALVARVSSLTTLRLRGCVPAHRGAVGVGSLPVGDNSWIGANFGTSAALNSVSTYANDLPDHTALVGMRRSA